MKKAFNLTFLAISALLMLGHAVAFAQQDPQNGQAVGTSIQGGVVTYRVNGASVTYSGEKAYPVTITGLDADGLAALGTNISLEVPVTFREKLGEKYYRFFVTRIDAGLNGTTKQSFYGYTEISDLKFTAGPDGTAAYPLTSFTYTVGDKAFYGCTGMKSLEFTENCSFIGQYAFQNTSIRNFVIPKKCATVDEYAFYNCKKLQTVSVAAGNTAMHILGTHVFGNSSLTTLDLRNAEQLWQIQGEPFMYNLSFINDVLQTVYLPTEVKAINYAFAKCTALTNLYGLENTSLGEAINKAFDKTGALVTRANAACIAGQHILAGAFEECKALTRLDIPNCNVYLSDPGMDLSIPAPFVGCASLDSLTFKAGYDKTIALDPNGIANTNLFGTFDNTLAAYSANDQSALKVIEFKGAMKGTIDANAFVGTKALAKVDFQGLLTNGATINAAFTDVTSLTEVLFNGINTWDGTASQPVLIRAFAFKNTGIAALDFKGITSRGDNVIISNNAFSDCANLADVKFGDFALMTSARGITIQGAAFNNNPLLAKVTFGKAAFTANTAHVSIDDDAFGAGNVALANVEFGDITSTTSTPAGFDGRYNIGLGWSPVFGDTKGLQTVKFGNIDLGQLNIQRFAFQSTGLESVEFGNIKTPYAVNSTVTIGVDAFASAFTVGVSEPEAKIVKFGNISENNVGQMTFTIRDGAFRAVSLKEVEFKNITATDVDIEGTGVGTNGAFTSDNLQKVKFGNITASSNAASTFDIDNDAFAGGNVAAKTVEIGNIVNSAAQNLVANIGNFAFQADSLASVKIGNMTANTININMFAFAGQALASVTLGNVGAGVATVGGSSFANTNVADAMTETITIGNLAAANFAGGSVFRGPQAEGSALNVTIKAITGAVTIPGNTFEAPLAADGTASYIIEGNVGAGFLANIAANAFIGAQKYALGAPVDNATTVWFQGNYNDEFAAVSVFTNVKDLKIAVGADGSAKTYGVVGNLAAFQGAQTVTIGDMPAGSTIVANNATPGVTDEIVEITFLKNVTAAPAINVFNSPLLRKVEFANVATSGVKVAAAAVAAGAFEAAANNAVLASENISIIYREEQTREAEVIFNQQAFSTTADDTKVVTLYTTSWAKANVYEAADVVTAPAPCVYRLAYSESDVAPGEDIVATTAKKDGQVYAYAKLYIPKGTNMKYKVPAQYVASADKNAVQLYFGRIDNSNNKIYMYNMPVIDDYYWIDATDVDQQFVLRVNTDIVTLNEEVAQDANGNYVVTAQNPTEEDLATFAAGDPADYYFFDAALAVQNQLRYNPAEIANQELKNNAEFAGRDVYVMANPKTQGFAFAKFDKNGTYTKDTGDHLAGDLRCLSAKSLYIVGKVNDASKLTVVFEGDEDFDANETTGIKDVKSIDANDGVIYNLQGVRVNNATKGIFIQNGKKYVIK
jgi:hypothetical protein